MDKPTRHVLGLSGGKDSTALAIYMRDKVPQIEYFFCDTGAELRETYEYLERLQSFLGKSIHYLNPARDFDHWLSMYNGYLPSSRTRWCTRMLKIKPFEDFVGDAPTVSYIGIRADENRDGYISSKPNIKPIYPFKEAGIREPDVYRILDEAGIGMPKYYEWRTRSGCYFCFFQRKAEWVGLLERHPDLFDKAKQYEKIDEEKGLRYTWNQSESLSELADPKRIGDIKHKHEQVLSAGRRAQPGQSLFQIFGAALDEEDDTEPCMICNL